MGHDKKRQHGLDFPVNFLGDEGSEFIVHINC